jgi:hypothetical protein
MIKGESVLALEAIDLRAVNSNSIYTLEVYEKKHVVGVGNTAFHCLKETLYRARLGCNH